MSNQFDTPSPIPIDPMGLPFERDSLSRSQTPPVEKPSEFLSSIMPDRNLDFADLFRPDDAAVFGKSLNKKSTRLISDDREDELLSQIAALNHQLQQSNIKAESFPPKLSMRDLAADDPPFLDYMRQTMAISAQAASATSSMVQTLATAHEKPLNKLQSINSVDILNHIGALDPSSRRPLQESISLEFQKTLMREAKLGKMSMSDYNGTAFGETQPLIALLQEIVVKRQDVQPADLLLAFAMRDSKEVDFSALLVMVSTVADFIQRNSRIFDDYELSDQKKLIVNVLIKPIKFRDYLKLYFKSKYEKPTFSLDDLVDLISVQAQNVVQSNLTTNRVNLSAYSGGAASTGSEKMVADAVTTPPVPKSSWPARKPDNETIPCANCNKLTTPWHHARACKEPCRIHKRDCKSKNGCIHMDKERKRIEKADALAAYEIAHKLNGGAKSVPRKRKPKHLPRKALTSISRDNSDEIIIDTGANVLCSPSLELFTTSPSNDLQQIAVATGEPISIKGTGKINDCDAKYVPDFEKTLVPAAIITDHSLIVIDSEHMHILPNKSSTVVDVTEIINQCDPNIHLKIPVRNGLYPISKDLLMRLTKRCEHSLTANSSYFTAKLDSRGEIVRFWHEAWKHANKKDMIRIVRFKIFNDIPPELTITAINKYFNDHCRSCKKATLRERPKPQHSDRIYATGEGCTMDISHFDTPDFSGNRYCCHSLDLGSGKSWVDIIPNLAELDTLLIRSHERYRDMGHVMKFFRIDKQFITADTKLFCKRRGVNLGEREVVTEPPIDIEQPGPHEHAQNGSIECLIKHMKEDCVKALDSAQLLTSDGTIDNRYWSKAMHWVNDVRNDLPEPGAVVSRNVAWGHKITSLTTQPMFPFATRVLAHLPLTMQTSLSGRAIATLYMGRAPGIKGGILLHNLSTNRTICRVSFKIMGLTDPIVIPTKTINVELSDEDGFNSYIYDEYSHTLVGPPIIEDPTLGVPSVPDLGVPTVQYERVQKSDLTVIQANRYWPKISMEFYDRETSERMRITGIYLRKSMTGPGSRTPYFQFFDVLKYPESMPEENEYEYQPCAELIRAPENKWLDEVNLAQIDIQFAAVAYFITNMHSIPKQCRDIADEYCEEYIDPSATGPQLRAMRADFLDQKKQSPPKTLVKAKTHPDSEGYLGAWMRETGAHLKRGCQLPADMPIGDIPPELILQLMPIFERKYVGVDFSKFKCRMVVLGNRWRNTHGVDTFATMVRMDTLKFLLSLGAVQDSDFFIIDVDEAFLTTKVNKVRPKRSVLDEDAPDLAYYTRRPPGATDADMPYIMKPNAFIYGHPLANPAFGADLHELLTDIGFTPTNFDSCVYVLRHALGTVILATAVDDMPAFLSGPPALKDYVLAGLRQTYSIKVEDPMRTVLGLEITRDRPNKLVTLRQRGQLDDLLNEFEADWATRDIESFAMIPAPTRHELGAADTILSSTPCDADAIQQYNRKHGKLLWLLHTMCDFKQAVNECSRHLKNPSLYHMKLIDQVISCMARVRRLDEDYLVLGGNEGVNIISTCDTSYAGHKDLKSHTGGTIHMSHSTGAIVTTCKKQSVTADSAMAAEGLGAHIQIKPVIGYRYFCEELDCQLQKPSDFYMDSEPFIKTIVGKRGLSDRAKHVLIQYQILKEAYAQDQIAMKHLNTKNMVSDLLTKPLPREDWWRLRGPLLGHSPIIINTTSVVDGTSNSGA